MYIEIINEFFLEELSWLPLSCLNELYENLEEFEVRAKYYVTKEILWL